MTDERTFGQLVADATTQISDIVRQELELAKAELAQSAKRAAAGSAMFGAAAYLVLLSVVIFLISAAYGLVALGVPAWLAFLIVGLALVLLAGLLVVIGRWQVMKVGPPRKAIESTKLTVTAISHHDAAEQDPASSGVDAAVRR